jgi:hypothetical protein
MQATDGRYSTKGTAIELLPPRTAIAASGTMRHLYFLLALSLLAVPSSCGQEPSGTSVAVIRPREGGVEVEPPKEGFRAVAGQTIFVPAYSSIFILDEPNRFNLAVTLSFRNADRKQPIIITSVRYFDHDGKLLGDYLKKPLRVEPMAAVEFFVREKDTSGGVSASFLVEWLAEQPVTNPSVESVMIGTASTQGVSFTCPGRVLADRSHGEKSAE